MAKEDAITEENFEMLLAWLDLDQDAAAQKYEKIRQRLIRILRGRGCFEAEELADATFNRVIGKLPQIADGYTGDPTLYFYGVADKIYLEWLRRQKKINQTRLPPPEISDAAALEIEYECLANCLAKLPADQHRLIVGYYREIKSAKIENRRKMAQTFGISPNALQVKASRVRSQLKGCIENCIALRSAR